MLINKGSTYDKKNDFRIFCLLIRVTLKRVVTLCKLLKTLSLSAHPLNSFRSAYTITAKSASLKTFENSYTFCKPANLICYSQYSCTGVNQACMSH